jgi:hypothetical protein
MRDLRLDPVTWELATVNNDLAFIDGVDELVQNLKIRLQFFLGEWLLDTTQGVDWIGSVFVQNPNIPHINGLIKKAILDTDGVIALQSFASAYDPAARTFTVTFTVQTTEGTTESVSITMP